MTAIATPPVLIKPSVPREYTDDELLKLSEDGASEFIDGQVRAKNMGADSAWTAARLGGLLTIHLIQTPVGDLFTEQSYRCFPDDVRGFRRPDISYTVAGRVPAPAPQGPLTVVPDLAIEVTSPNDEIDDLEEKLVAYRSVAVPLVWVVLTAVRTVRVYARRGQVSELYVGDNLTGGDILPGFSVPVASLFRPIAPTPG